MRAIDVQAQTSSQIAPEQIQESTPKVIETKAESIEDERLVARKKALSFIKKNPAI